MLRRCPDELLHTRIAQAASPQAIALHDGRVVGYCLSLLPALRAGAVRDSG